MSKSTCSARTTTGAVCRAPAGSGGKCFFHAHPDRAHTLGQIGGRKNRSKLVDARVPGPLSTAELRDILRGGDP